MKQPNNRQQQITPTVVTYTKEIICISRMDRHNIITETTTDRYRVLDAEG